MNGCIADTIPVMDRLLSHLEELKSEMVASGSPLLGAVESAWAKLDKYYQLTDEVPLYIVSLF
jgi:hypothetical protein